MFFNFENGKKAKSYVTANNCINDGDWQIDDLKIDNILINNQLIDNKKFFHVLFLLLLLKIFNSEKQLPKSISKKKFYL